MNAKRIVGILLILLGAAGLYLREISYKTEENVMNVGPMKATMETRKVIPIHPVISGLVIAGGIALLAIGGKKP